MPASATAIRLQPKQAQVLDWCENSPHVWIGVGGGRGAAKSGGADRVVLSLAMSQPGIVMCVVMRNYDQVRKYHIEPLLRTFPELEDYFTSSTAKLRIPVGGGFHSEIDFSYAENLQDVERRFRSANYKYIIVDQAEQFTELELREMKKACRWPGGGLGNSKMVLLFNMGGAGIQTLRKWFHTKEYNEREDPNDFTFIHVHPWDNVEWSRSALAEDGFTEVDYYAWTDEDRQYYCAKRSEYGKSLNSEDDAIRNRDWLGSWDSLEGAYFGRVFDLQSTRITPHQVSQIIKSWDSKWLAQDWGKSHFTYTCWSAKSMLAPSEVLKILGWTVQIPLTVVVTYRELVANETTSRDMARLMVDATPEAEREQLSRYFLSPDAFGDRDSGETIAINQGNVLRPLGMPIPSRADNDRVGGWQLMADLLQDTKRHGAVDSFVWLISSECPQLLNAIPLLMRDPKNLDDVLKTDKGQARLEQDVADGIRYNLKSMLKPNRMPEEEKLRQKILASSPEVAHQLRYAETMRRQKKSEQKPYWD